MMPELQVEYPQEKLVKALAEARHRKIKYRLCFMCGTAMTPEYEKLNARELAYKLIEDGHRPQFTQKLTPVEQIADFVDPAIRGPKLAAALATNPRAAGNYVEQVTNRLARSAAYHDVNTILPGGGE